MVSNDAGADVPSVVAALSIAAGRFDTRSAVAVFTGQPHGPVPLSSVTPGRGDQDLRRLLPATG